MTINSLFVLLLTVQLLGAPLAMADIVYGAYKGTGLATPEDAFTKSLAQFDVAVVGTIVFSIDEAVHPKRSKYKFRAKLAVLDYLKGRKPLDYMQFLGSGLRGCIPSGAKEAFQRRVDALFSDGKEGSVEFEKMVSQLPIKSSDGECFVAMEVYAGDFHRPYKHRYELIFQGQTYVIFLDTHNISGDRVTPVQDLAPYDATFMKPIK